MAHYYLADDRLGLVVAVSPKCGSYSVRAWFAEAAGCSFEELDDFVIGRKTAIERKDSWKVLVVRDPLRRLVSFYSLWVVRYQSPWCFADAEQRLPLVGKSFRELLLALRHLSTHGLEFQHHLVPQVENLEDVRFDQVIAVERLQEGLAELNRRLSVEVAIPHRNATPFRAGACGPVCDRRPDWFREQGIPTAEHFFDEEARRLAIELYAPDVELYRRETGLEVCPVLGGL